MLCFFGSVAHSVFLQLHSNNGPVADRSHVSILRFTGLQPFFRLHIIELIGFRLSVAHFGIVQLHSINGPVADRSHVSIFSFTGVAAIFQVAHHRVNWFSVAHVGIVQLHSINGPVADRSHVSIRLSLQFWSDTIGHFQD